ncbi:MAG: zinc ABC transporter substrate-binding protein [bacterium]
MSARSKSEWISFKNQLLTLCCAVLFVTLSGCGENKQEAGATGDAARLKVVTTIGMITDVVEQIGGKRVRVAGLMGPGVDPHLYKASAGDVELMSEADIIFYGGLHLEGAMTELFEQMQRRTRTVAVAQAVPAEMLLSPKQFAGAHDPHIWFDVSLWVRTVDLIRDNLIALDSGGVALFSNNADSLKARLFDLHQYVRTQAARVPQQQRVLITAHDAFNYFGRAYGFEVRGLQGISTATEAGTADIQQLATFIAERKIPAIFIESSVSPRNIEAVQAAVKARGFEVKIGGELFSDAMGDPGTPEGSYIGMVKHNIDTVVSALLGEK